MFCFYSTAIKKKKKNGKQMKSEVDTDPGRHTGGKTALEQQGYSWYNLLVTTAKTAAQKLRWYLIQDMNN